jgi:two-component system chemotaxis sensor kinase CheA
VAARRTRSRQTRAQREFVSEAEEILERMRGDLGELAEPRGGDDEPDPELVNRLFRSAHSLKGISGLFGFDALTELAHRAEDLLDGLRLGRVRSHGAALSLLDESVSVFRSALAGLSGSTGRDELEPRVADLVARIEAAGRSVSGGAPLAGLGLEPTLLRALTEYEEHRLQESLRRGRRVHRLELCFELADFETGLREIGDAVRELGEVVSTLPSATESPEAKIRFTLLVASELDAEALRERLQLPDGALEQVSREPGDPGESAPAADVPAASTLPSSFPEGDDSLRSISDTVRVDIRKLDELMNLVGELVLHRATIGSIATRLSRQAPTARFGAELAKVHKSLDRKLQDLQAGVLDVRMVPLRQVFEKLSRVVRRLRADLGKDVRLEIRGADTELDKLIVEELVDPLMHLVRNAFDHAIEDPEQRTRAGKPVEGGIRIDAHQRGSHVVIDVSDDGRGIDPEVVRARAEARGLVPRDAVLSPAEALELVFLPGFSTRDEVTETSGRGVGMDVVRANLAGLGGVVEIDSEAGRGTRITLTLPITLAIIQALLVGAGGQRFAIPLNSVLETLAVRSDDLQRSHAGELLNLRGEPLPVRRLAEVFGLSGSASEAAFVVVVGLGEVRAGIVVESLLGQQDTVIKPIQGPVADVPGVAGATELSDQGAVLVLDVAAIVEGVARRREAA